jgi:hypothetical protein
MERFVMPAWMAGIDASGDIHVRLDSSIPCWNDGIEESVLRLTQALHPRVFSRSA